jgi:hypothetical protein
MVENRYRVTLPLKWLPAGPTPSGGDRRDDLVQFIAYKGGKRTVRVKDIVDIR